MGNGAPRPEQEVASEQWFQGGALEVVGGWEKTKNKKQRGPGGPALRTRPRRGKKSDIDHGIS